MSSTFKCNKHNRFSASVTNGTCKVTDISWTKLWCEGTFEEYYVPVIKASFRNVTYFGYKVSSYTGLYVNKDRISEEKVCSGIVLFISGLSNVR